MYGWSNTTELSLKLFTVLERLAASWTLGYKEPLSLVEKTLKAASIEAVSRTSASATDYEAIQSRTHKHTHTLSTDYDNRSPHRAAYPTAQKKS